MARTTLNDLNEAHTLSTDEQKTLRGGFFGWNPFFFMPRYNPMNPFAFGYGGFNNVFQPGSVGFGIQAATFQGQALGDMRHASFMANF
jgi:hypothetical protein